MAKYYKKEIPESPVYIFGQALSFDFLQTEDDRLIGELDKCVQRGVGGVMSITKEQYEEEIKKKETLRSLQNSSNRPQQRQELQALRLDARRVVEAASNPAPRLGMFAKPQVPPPPILQSGTPMPEPIEVPSPASFSIKPPPTIKQSSLKKK